MKFRPRKAASSVLTENPHRVGPTEQFGGEDKKVEEECRALYTHLWPLPTWKPMLRIPQTHTYITHMHATCVNIIKQQQNILQVKGTGKGFLKRNGAHRRDSQRSMYELT